MDHLEAVRALSALAQEHRLLLFRLLVLAGDAGMTAGQLADAADIPPTRLSFHIKELERAGLVFQCREGRFIRYRLAVEGMRALMTFLTDQCCGGRPELCGVVAPEEVDVCCQPRQESAHVKPR